MCTSLQALRGTTDTNMQTAKQLALNGKQIEHLNNFFWEVVTLLTAHIDLCTTGNQQTQLFQLH